MFLRFIFACAILVQTTFLFHTKSYAQSAKLAISEEDFSEGFSGKVNVSTAGALVGMRLGSSAGWDLDSVTLVPENKPDSIICLRSSTLDGRFWAENPYLVEEGFQATSVGPISKTYRKSLKSYPREQLTFRASVNLENDCSSEAVEYYIPSIGRGDSELIVYLNSGDRNTFSRLSLDGKTGSIDTKCEPIDGFSSVIADRVCKMDVENFVGDSTLQVLFITNEGGKDSAFYKIKLPDLNTSKD